MSFNDIIGHDKIKKQLEMSIASQKLAHAHIIAGEDGIGKSLIASVMAREILGKKEKKQYADIIEWRLPKDRQSIGIKDIILIIEEINKKPFESDRKVIIVHDANLMTVEAQNAFLKTIEEPPHNVYIILLCENLINVLETIVSRCEIHRLTRLSKDEMESFLKKKYPDINCDRMNMAVKFSGGIPGRAEKILVDEQFKDIRNTVSDILIHIKDRSVSSILNFEGFFIKYKKSWHEIMDWFILYVRDTIIYKETGNTEFIMNNDKFPDIKYLAGQFSFSELQKVADIVCNTSNRLNCNVNYILTCESMLLTIKEV